MSAIASSLLAQSTTGTTVGTGMWVAIIVGGVVILTVLLIVGQFFRLWIQAFMSKAEVGFTDLIGMKLRKVDLNTIVLARQDSACQSGFARHQHQRAGESLPRRRACGERVACDDRREPRIARS